MRYAWCGMDDHSYLRHSMRCQPFRDVNMLLVLRHKSHLHGIGQNNGHIPLGITYSPWLCVVVLHECVRKTRKPLNQLRIDGNA